MNHYPPSGGRGRKMSLRKLKSVLRAKEHLPYLVSDLVNIRYLTGFTGSYACMIIGDKKSFFISDSRYEEYARDILPESIDFVLLNSDLYETIRGVLKRMGEKALYLEEHSIMLSTYLEMKARLRGIRLVPGESEVNRIRIIKKEEETVLLMKAAEITDRCFYHLLGFIKPGMIEWEVAAEIESFYRANGCRKSSFPAIVASGSGSSMPHYETSMTKKIEPGDVLLIDMGCEYMGYNSDLTRTIFVHSVDPFLEKIYRIVLDAQAAALGSVKPGITTGALDGKARQVIADAGYGDNFGHSLGHGLGLEVHELPAVKSGDFRLKKNMVITVEPGVYVPGRGGVRIEDMVLVTGTGGETLTKCAKEITIV